MRQGDTLARIGKMAELFDDFSPLQLFAAGRIQDQPFTLVGRLQYSYAGGRWTEWIAALDGDRTGILSEDNGAFVFSLPFELQRAAPPAGRAARRRDHRLQRPELHGGLERAGRAGVGPGRTAAAARARPRPSRWSSCAATRAWCSASTTTRSRPAPTSGRAVQLEDLQLTGLRDESAKDEKGRSFNCPQLRRAGHRQPGRQQEHHLPRLQQHHRPDAGHRRRAEACDAGRAGAAADPARHHGPAAGRAVAGGRLPAPHGRGARRRRAFRLERVPALQQEARLQLPGRCRGRLEHGQAHHRRADAWPRTAPGATYLGKVYQQQYAYNAETTYVAGEFYWQVERGQKTFNRDFASGAALLSMERSAKRADLVRRAARSRARPSPPRSSSTARRTCSSAATRCP